MFHVKHCHIPAPRFSWAGPRLWKPKNKEQVAMNIENSKEIIHFKAKTNAFVKILSAFKVVLIRNMLTDMRSTEVIITQAIIDMHERVNDLLSTHYRLDPIDQCVVVQDFENILDFYSDFRSVVSKLLAAYHRN